MESRFLVHNKNDNLILLDVHMLAIAALCQKVLFICNFLTITWALQYFSFCNSNDIKVSLVLQLKDDVPF